MHAGPAGGRRRQAVAGPAPPLWEGSACATAPPRSLAMGLVKGLLGTGLGSRPRRGHSPQAALGLRSTELKCSKSFALCPLNLGVPAACERGLIALLSRRTTACGATGKISHNQRVPCEARCREGGGRGLDAEALPYRPAAAGAHASLGILAWLRQQPVYAETNRMHPADRLPP